MATQRRPIVVVLAGPNGAGKSTITPIVQIGPKIDRDAIAQDINPANPDAAALPAARRAIAEMKTFKEQGRSFTYETTLSSNTSLREIDDAITKAMRSDSILWRLAPPISPMAVQDRVNEERAVD